LLQFSDWYDRAMAGPDEMIRTANARRGIAVAPHAAAAQSALEVLREGGNAIEAMVAAAATISVVYPHMNGIGGDAFWVAAAPGEAPFAIDACGPAAERATPALYAGMKAIPVRGPLAANTVAGTVAGWELALAISRARWGGKLPLARLLEDSIRHAESGFPTTASQEAATSAKRRELENVAGFPARFTPGGTVPPRGLPYFQRTLGKTLRQLAGAGLQDFYRGELARSMARDLAALGSPLALSDLEAYVAKEVPPLELGHSLGRLYNMTAPTQGAVSLAILGILDRIGAAALAPESADHVHAVVEATKAAFLGVRDPYLADPARMAVAPQALLEPARLDALAAGIDMRRARPWGGTSRPGGTVWMGAIDGAGRAVSFIQSLYHEFGSGLVLPQTHVNWQNRGCSFSLDAARLNALAPGRKPFHTLNPALARFADGRAMVYGTMGGDGQPQTQAAVFTRYALYGQPLGRAVSAPRWLLGRTWGSMSESLKLEARFAPQVVEELRARGHEVELLGEYDETMGHAGALVRDAQGALEGAADPRSDGGVAGF
jgi:gamma-glutamyltranspeptidase/glutathione hydrolase